MDPGETEPVVRWLAAHGLALGAVVVTHHHWDHTNGIGGLRARWPVRVYGPAHESHPIEALSDPLEDGDEARIDCLDATFRAIHIPGHTLGHTAFHGEDLLFPGDTLFSAGCGRLFEGTPRQMHDSLTRLAALPDTTQIFCGHEYTEANLAFALTVEPDNREAEEQRDHARTLRSAGEPTLPSTIGREHAINPFLRCEEPTVARAASDHAGKTLGTPVEVFAALRAWKDNFKPVPT